MLIISNRSITHSSSQPVVAQCFIKGKANLFYLFRCEFECGIEVAQELKQVK